jgi:hypothetical protein
VNTARTDKELEHMLEAAIIANWHELFRSSATPASVHVEYQEHYGEALEYFKVWVTWGKGHWDLVCECWPHAAALAEARVRFSNGYDSPGLRRGLEPAIRRFAISGPDLPVGGVVQLYPPTEQKLAAAVAWFDGRQHPTGERVSPQPAATQSPLAIDA